MALHCTTLWMWLCVLFVTVLLSAHIEIFSGLMYIWDFLLEHYLKMTRILAGLVNSTLILRCFPPSSQEATTSLGVSGNLETKIFLENTSYLENTSPLESTSSLKNTSSLENTSSLGSNWCLPRDYPVAEAGPGVSYPGYKQYCRYG